MKDTFVMFALLFLKRRSRVQKQRFINALNGFFKERGRTMRLVDKKMSVFLFRNLFVGDLKSAGSLIVAPYDVPDRALFGYRYDPSDMDSLKRYNKKLFAVLTVLISVAVGCAIVSFMNYDKLIGWMRPVVLVANVLLLGFALLLGKGFPNFNNHSEGSALAVACESLFAGKGDGALLLCDMSFTTGIGFKQFMSDYPEAQKKKIVFVDALAPGGDAVVFCNPGDLKKAQKLASYISEGALAQETTGVSTISGLSGALLVCAGVRDSDGRFFIPNVRTPRDLDADVDMLEAVKNGIVKYLA